MKALSLWQPWASLVAVGAKRYETRSWKTDYRGPLVICAAKRRITRCEFLAFKYEAPFAPMRKVLMREKGCWSGDFSQLPLGAALCVVDLVACYSTEHIENGDAHLRHGREHLLATDEPSFGDFTEGRFAWRLENVRRLWSPVRVTGRQGLFDLMPAEARQVEDQLDVIERTRLAGEARA